MHVYCCENVFCLAYLIRLVRTNVELFDVGPVLRTIVQVSVIYQGLTYRDCAAPVAYGTVRGSNLTRKPSYRWQTRATRNPAKIAPIRRAYNVVADNTGLSSCVLTVITSEIREIPRNSLKIQTYGVQGRSSKVIDLSVNRKPMYDFLLVTNSNFGRICYRFRDIDAWSWKIADFTNPSRL